MKSGAILRQRLSQGETVVGPFARFADPAAMEILGHVGFDFSVIDLEHSSLGLYQAQNLVRAGELTGLCPIIRVPENNSAWIARALDTGAGGVLIPQVESIEDAQRAVRAGRFHPQGQRGICPYTRSSSYSKIPKQDYFSLANEQAIIALLVEGQGGMKDIDAILELEGFDILFVGPYDLSQSLGIPGQVTHEKVLSTVADVARRARERGVALGCFADDLDAVERWAKLGVQFLSTFLDTRIFYSATEGLIRDIRQRVESSE